MKLIRGDLVVYVSGNKPRIGKYAGIDISGKIRIVPMFGSIATKRDKKNVLNLIEVSKKYKYLIDKQTKERE